MKKMFHVLYFVCLTGARLFAQHQPQGTADTAMKMNDRATMNHHSTMSMDHDMSSMSSAHSINLPMERSGSGTSWVPDAAPMYADVFHSGKWMYMLHGNVAPRFDQQDIFSAGSKGSNKFDAPNWLMGMAQRKIGKNDLVHFSMMLSFDPLTEGGYGYPLLFQTGESWKGIPLVDRQHPHDLFSELSVSYTHAFTKKTDVFIYLGYPGEPALGSVAFMHRPSAMANPDAPISHHWNDGTHITFGVATLGFRLDKFQVEGSSFTGREPDENRYNFDRPRFDSWSGRLSYNPTANWSMQISHGFIKSPEMLQPLENVHRTTASVLYSIMPAFNETINATILWGMNKINGQNGQNAFLFELAVRKAQFEWYTRYEWVQKTGEELDLFPIIYDPLERFAVQSATLGLNIDVLQNNYARAAFGAQFTVSHSPERIENLYGKNPCGGEFFIRLYPGAMKMKAPMTGMKM